jgi:uncharacterized protein
MSKTILLSDEFYEHDDPADNIERALKQKLKDNGISESWINDHLIIEMPEKYK